MASYFFQLSLSENAIVTKEIVEENNKHVEELFADGRMISYSIAANRNFVWCIINAEDEMEAMGLIADFPSFSLFADIQCHLLLYHQQVPASLPDISMN
ncbi:hypothetical protein ACTHGU_19510 [Chitinophagaceae bacterium MMS25-I14]